MGNIILLLVIAGGSRRGAAGHGGGDDSGRPGLPQRHQVPDRGRRSIWHRPLGHGPGGKDYLRPCALPGGGVARPLAHVLPGPLQSLYAHAEQIPRAHALDFLTEVTYGQYGLVSRRNRWTSTEYTDGSGYIAALMKDDWANLVAKHDDPVKFIKGRASDLGLDHKRYSDVGFLDDMLEAASGAESPLGVSGHMLKNRNYWSQLRGQMPSVEALADYAGSAVGNRVEWELMRELFPQATYAMDGLLEAILNATP